MAAFRHSVNVLFVFIATICLPTLLYAENVVQESKPDSPNSLPRLVVLVILIMSLFYRWQAFTFGVIFYVLFNDVALLRDIGETFISFSLCVLITKRIMNKFLA